MHQPLRARAIRILVFTLCFAATLFLTNCATQPRPEAHDPPGSYNMRKASNGDIYLATGAGIARIAGGGAPQLVLPFPLRLDNNLTVNSPGQIDVNGAGALLFQSSTSAGDNRIFIYQNGEARQLLVLSATASTASTIDGRIVQS